MARAARDRLARTLRGDTQTAFSVELTARTGDLTLEVEGFGPALFIWAHDCRHGRLLL